MYIGEIIRYRGASSTTKNVRNKVAYIWAPGSVISFLDIYIA
jgi:hypothetical protein